MAESFIIIFSVLLVEMFMSIMHFRFYYLFGLTVFQKEIFLPGNLPGTLFDTADAILGDDRRFTIAALSDNEIGFRKVIRRNNGFHFRGVITQDLPKRCIKFSIKLNWSILVFLFLCYEVLIFKVNSPYYVLLFVSIFAVVTAFEFYGHLKILKIFEDSTNISNIGKIRLRSNGGGGIVPQYDSSSDGDTNSDLVECTNCRESYFRVDLPEPYCLKCHHPITGITISNK